MATQPRDEDVAKFVELTGITQQEARARLRSHNNDIDTAMNEFFDNPDSTQYQWDESQFSDDREGNSTYNPPGFKIDAPIDYGGYHSSAPTRPPSRSSNKSPMQGRVISLEKEHAAADPYSRTLGQEMADPDLQRAIEESKVSAGLLEPQQYGTVEDNNVKYFGPANQTKDYNSSRWDMVHVPSASVEELEPRPDPVDRKREVGHPAFLRPTSGNGRLAALITIFHEIPLTRELLLDQESVLQEYGYDKSWWEGTAIDVPEQPPTYDADILQTARQPVRDKLVYEVQRLMAFLDKTDRAYGSADVLHKISSRYRHASMMDVEIRFLERWKDIYTGRAQRGTIFSKAIQLVDPEVNPDTEDQALEFAVLDIDLPAGRDAIFLETLYDVLDNMLWRQSGETLESTAYISNIGDVFSFKLSTSSGAKAIEIPLIWYPDRYLDTAKEEALEMRLRKEQVKDDLKRALRQEGRLVDFNMNNGKSIKVKTLLERAAKASALDASQGVNGSPHNAEQTEIPSAALSGGKRDLAAELLKVGKNIDIKLKELQHEKERALASLRELSSLLTQPKPERPLHPYFLRGFSATKDITYICRKAEPDLIDMDLDDKEERSNGDQWWKCIFSSAPGNRKPVEITKVSTEDIKLALATEVSEPLLIYANETALSIPQLPLPSPLEAFVHADNVAFSEEFADSHSSPDVTSPKSPGKRKLGETDEDSDLQEAPNRYSEKSVKFGGTLTPPTENDEDHHGPSVSHHEIVEISDPEQVDSIDMPNMDGMQEQKCLTTEMQGRKGMPSLIPGIVAMKSSEAAPGPQSNHPNGLVVESASMEDGK